MKISVLSFSDAQFIKKQYALSEILSINADKLKDEIHITLLDREPRLRLLFRRGALYGAEGFFIMGGSKKLVACGHLRCVEVEPFHGGCIYTMMARYSDFNRPDWKNGCASLFEKITRILF